MSRNSADRPVFGCFAGRPGERRGDAVDQGDSLIIEGDHALAVELAERDFQPGAGAGDLVDAVQFEVAQLADAQPGGAGEQERVGEQTVRGVLQGLADEPVGVGGQVAGQRPREFGDVAGEHEPSGRRVGPFPFGDVGQEPAEGDDPVPLFPGADGLPAADCRGDGGRGQVGLDVTLPVQAGEGVQAGIDGGEVAAEVRQPDRDPFHRRGFVRPGDRRRVVLEPGGEPGRDAAEVVRMAVVLAASAVRRCRVDDPEVEQHGPGGVEDDAVVGPVPAAALAPGPERRLGVAQVTGGKIVQAPAGLD